MQLLYGKPIADEILSRLKRDISAFEKKPRLDVILVGSDKASHLYVELKEKKAHEIGMDFFRHDFPENSSEDEIAVLISELNVNADVSGIIVQLPLPAKFDTDRIISAINPKKDADGFSDKGGLLPVFPRAILKLIQSAGQNLAGKKAVVVANSDEFGAVMCKMLQGQNLDSSYVLSQNLPSNLGKIEEADVVVSAVGSPGLLKGEMLKDGAIVIDGGIEKIGEKVLGDVDFASIEAKDGFLTPVPGGVGPVTIACLLENVYLAFEAQQKEK